MRAPRALIPLVAVCGAGVVVALAGAGAAIEKSPALGSTDAGKTQPLTAAGPLAVNVVTWDVCGDAEPGCPLGSDSAGLVRRIDRQLGTTTVAGKAVQADALLLQRVCSEQVRSLKGLGRLKSWSWIFTPQPAADDRSPRACVNGQGKLGLAVATRKPITDVRHANLPSQPGHGRVAVCGTVQAWSARVCTAQLSSSDPGDDPDGAWRAKQAQTLLGLADADRVIIGGDFTDKPRAKSLDAFYSVYTECGGDRTGAPTSQDASGKATDKTDYLFASHSATLTCTVPPTPVRSSNHRPITATIHFT
ncbi:endonuclease/exonuclease/phosphatase family protein [Actinomadura rupiterrae]|uniref:endonuclease/exonuclease/phosphatase family protein n=1 Tax=Actinomadura rupiterrae TaxID=559627 RepID=UPI0020A2F908|nr:endonuclease/exonuclease/phosphatase family protein [Actinomadura rupiterrae]MCP2338045.1 endonuclease/exonuclease/phosphatase family metal-dependent hydrolase [Actinomadura rupiterrae]